MEKKKIIEINSAFEENDIVKIKATDSENKQIYLSIPTLDYFNRRDNEKKRIFSDDKHSEQMTTDQLMHDLQAANQKEIDAQISVVWNVAKEMTLLSSEELYKIFGHSSLYRVFKYHSPYEVAKIIDDYINKNGVDLHHRFEV